MASGAAQAWRPGDLPKDLAKDLDKDLAKDLVKKIKDAKYKVQVSIQGDELRVTGKKRDDLQEVIAFVKSLKNEQPLQFKNFRD